VKNYIFTYVKVHEFYQKVHANAYYDSKMTKNGW